MQDQPRNVIGLDIAKTVFHAHVVTSDGSIAESRRLRRKDVLDWAAAQEPALVGIEACSTAHHWARELMALGQSVRTMCGPTTSSKAGPMMGGSSACST